MYWWELITKDGERYEIPPDAVEVVQRRMGNKEVINLSTASIPFSEIKHFRVTAKPFGQQPLLEAAAQAFNEPMLNPDGSMIVRWVKCSVPRRLYDKHYAHIPSYRKLGDDGTAVVIAFRLPIHSIDVNKVTECTENELTDLT
jgi:hypothetical protein